MWITGLELRNIKSHAESGAIPFARGVNAISGPNGAGKSTLLEAIGFALFDSLPYTQSQFLREGEKSGEVVVSFIDVLDEREYQVVRTVGTSSIYIFDPQVKSKIVSGKTDVVDWLKEHLGMDRTADLTALFEDSIGVPQGLLTAAFLENPAGRKSKFDPLLQVDEYEQAWIRLREVARVLGDEANDLGQKIAALTGELKQLPEMEDEQDSLAKEVETQKALQLERETQLEQTELEQATLEERQLSVRELERQVEKLQSQKQTIENQHANAESAVSESKAASDKLKEVRQSFETYLQAEERLKELETLRSKRDARLQDKNKLDREIALLEQRIESLQTSLDEMRTIEEQIKRIEPEVQRQQELEQSLSDVGNQISELEVQNNLLAADESKLATLEEQLAKTRNDVALHTTLADQQETARKNIQSLEIQIAQLETDRTSAQLQLVKLEQHRAALDDSGDAACPVCHQPLDDRHRIRLIEDYEDQAKRLQGQVQLNLEEQAAARTTLEEKRSELASVTKRLEGLPDERQLNSLTVEFEALSESVRSRRVELEQLAIVRDRLAELQQALDALGDPKTRWALLRAQVSSRDEIELELESSLQLLEGHKAELSELQTQLGSFEGLQAQLEENRNQRQETEVGYRTYLEHSTLAERLDERLEKLKDSKVELDSLVGQLEKLQRSFKRAKDAYDENRHAQVKSEVIDITRDLARLETLTEEQGKRLARLDDQISKLTEKQKELEQFKVELKRSEDAIEALEFIRSTIRSAGPFVTRALVQTISIEANRIFGEIMNDHSLRLIWNEDYSISIEKSGEVRDFSQLSGGEKMAAALSVRLALLRELSEIRLAFFDEPTSNLDDQRRENLASQITQISGFNQLFVISHDDTFERETHHIIRVDKSQGTSTVEVG